MSNQQVHSPQERVYLIRDDNEEVFSAGLTEAGEQVLIGAHPNFSLLAVVFDTQGQFLRVDSRQPSVGNAQETWEALERWKHEVGFHTHTIGIRRFFLDHERTGIADLPEFMRTYLEFAPDEEDPGYKPGLYESIEQFIRDQQFVLSWGGKEFWMSRDGKVTDT